ncbi:hypothetical protein I8751_21895 [Nostocaceae cyanobacterium CENA357]|uniref:Uncharacterized protein n=1 Tax=Atlanticothrix silvestris CENA357 TaxID=1725252 RepID=A0A8J7L4M2_9CYAN|nr:hypothetical protein [Atlanticothrix silvestris]MBH8554951.1 hypothetical protein [Atlanticothrix silvestris CENA357]
MLYLNQIFRELVSLPTSPKRKGRSNEKLRPIFKIIAWRWFKKNCPQLITKWLQGQIAFKIVEKSKTQVVLEKQDPNLNSLAKSQYHVQEVKLLRSQVKLLTGILVSIITIFGGSFIWLS